MDKKILKKSVLGLIIFVIILGILFLSLDILDINEDFRVDLPVKYFNTVFVAAFAAFLTCMAARTFLKTGSTVIFSIGCAQLALGIGSLMKEWLPDVDLCILRSTYESTALLASIIFITGGILTLAGAEVNRVKPGQRPIVVISVYIGILLAISLITLLIFQEYVAFFDKLGGSPFTLQDIFQRTSSVFLFAASLIHLRFYFRSREDIFYWFFSGLILMACGVLFLSLSPFEGRLAWLGRASQYLGNLCFILAVVNNFRQIRTPQADK